MSELKLIGGCGRVCCSVTFCKILGLGIKRPSIAIKMLIKDCIRKRSILGLDCNIPEVVDENGYNRDERDRSSTEVRHS